MARSSNATLGWNLSNSNLGTSFPAARTGPWTIAFWFKAANLSQSSCVILDTMEDWTGWRFIVFFENVDNKISLFHNVSTVPTGNEITVPDTSWHHYAYRKNATGSSSMDRFIDGTKTQITAGASFDLYSSSSNFINTRLMESLSNANELAGDLAEFGLWTTNLSDADISNLASGSVDGSTLSPVHFWPLCGTVSPETDFGSGAKNLTVNNVTQSTHPTLGQTQCGGTGGSGKPIHFYRQQRRRIA